MSKNKSLTLAEWTADKQAKLAKEIERKELLELEIREVYLSIKDFVHSAEKTEAGIARITELKAKVKAQETKIKNLKHALR